MKSLLFPLLFLAVLYILVLAAVHPKEILMRVLWPVHQYGTQHFVMGIRPTPKAVLVIAPVSKTNAATASGSFDTLGYDHLSVDIWIPTADTTTDGVSVCKLSESDDTTTTVTDIVAFVGGTQTSATVGFVLPAGSTTLNTSVKMNVDLKKRKRYLTLTVVPRTTQLLVATGQLQIGEQEPTQAADAGVTVLVNG